MAERLRELASTTWDYIFVGGGLSASVVSHRLRQLDSTTKILVVEAGPNANDRSDIVWPSSTNLVGGDFDWKDTTIDQPNLDGRSITVPSGKALGGGTVINSSGWIRGHKFDYDLWGSTVNDARWSYDGLLPYMKKSERVWTSTFNPEQHGLDGPNQIQSTSSIHRELPLRNHVLQSLIAIGINPLPELDINGGESLGVGELQENRANGKRQIAAAVYSLEQVEVLTDTLVEKVLVRKNEESGGRLVAVGIQLADGTEIRGHETVVSAGALRTPQILKLSGIGPAEELARFGIPVLLDQKDVGEHLADHGMFPHAWKVKDPSAGWALGSGNPLFNKEQYGWGNPGDFIVHTDVPEDGLAAAIAEDEGAPPSPDSHPLLARKRAFVEFAFLSLGAPDGSLVLPVLITLLPTARGSVKLASSHAHDMPLIDPNYLGTAVDRYVAREGLKKQIRFAGSEETVLGREILDGEVGAPGFDRGLSVASTDSEIDSRLRAGFGTCYHYMGTAAMGKVVDTDLRVKGVDGLRVVDASVFPVPITGHLQAAAFALAEQAAEIIHSSRLNARC